MSIFSAVIQKNTLIVKDIDLTQDFVLQIYEFVDQQQSTYSQQQIYQSQYHDYHHTSLDYDDEDVDDDDDEDDKIDTDTDLTNIHGLDFWNCSFEDDVSTTQMLSDVIMVISDITIINKIYFSNNLLNDNDFKIIAKGLIYLYDLIELRIISNEITYLSLATLCDLFANKNCKLKRRLKILDLSDNPKLIQMTEDGIQSFELFVCMVLSNSNIELLKLSHSPYLTSNHIYILSQWILNDKLCHLRRLDLSKNLCNLPFIQSLCNIINRSDCYLETLILNDCRFSKDAAIYLGSNLYKNHNLYFISINGMALQAFLGFANSKNEIRVSKLSLCDLLSRTQTDWYQLSYGSISDSIVNIISYKCLYLQQLYFNRGDLNNDEVSNMAAFLTQYPWLRTLSLCHNILNHGCLKKLSHAVRMSQKEAIKQTKIYSHIIVQTINIKLFTQNIAFIIIQYLFYEPMNGIKCILLQGNNSINTQFIANFRNSSLLDAKILSKLAKTRYDGRENRNLMSHIKHKQLPWSKLLT